MIARLLLLLMLSSACASSKTMRAADAQETTPVSEPAPRVPAALSLEVDAMQASEAGDFNRAVSLLERAIRLSPNDARLWLSMAEVHATEGDWAKAESFAARAAGLASSTDPTQAEARALEKKARRRR